MPDGLLGFLFVIFTLIEMEKKYDLEDRLIKFACMCLSVCDLLPNTKTGQKWNTSFQKAAPQLH